MDAILNALMKITLYKEMVLFIDYRHSFYFCKIKCIQLYSSLLCMFTQ